MKNIEDLINTFENTGDNGMFFIGDYSNIEIATYIRQQKGEIERLLNVIKQSIKLTDKVDDMESARDLYDLVIDIKNKLYESDKRGD